MLPTFEPVHPVWPLISRLGEAQILLPMTGALAALLWRRGRSPGFVLSWLGWIGLMAAITIFSRLAFLGWGVGSARLDFTGISGHAMLAAAVYPVLFALLPAPGPRNPLLGHTLRVTAGLMLASLVAMSQVMMDAKSLSETVGGLTLGIAASALSLRRLAPGRQLPAPLPRWVPLLVAAWLLILPLIAPPSFTRALVTQLALSLSGRDTPYRRSDLHNRIERPIRHVPIDAARAAPHIPLHHSSNAAFLRGGSRRS